MLTFTEIAALRSYLDDARRGGASVGLVPTMGYLHDGHESLMRRSAAENDVTVVTIFVNPLQFAAGEDIDAYPRDLDGDAARAERSGVTCLFTPGVDEMYPEPVLTTVSVTGVSTAMEGASRPTHFNGVATVVSKLFNIAGPCRAYFGEKDFQQLAVVRRMVADLSIPVEIVGCATVREADGLARSSRNVYLSDAERAVAPVLYRALRAGRAAINEGETNADAVRALMANIVNTEPLANLDYVEVADSATLEPQAICTPSSRLIGAVKFGRARLIDNIGLTADENEPITLSGAVNG